MERHSGAAGGSTGENGAQSASTATNAAQRPPGRLAAQRRPQRRAQRRGGGVRAAVPRLVRPSWPCVAPAPRPCCCRPVQPWSPRRHRPRPRPSRRQRACSLPYCGIVDRTLSHSWLVRYGKDRGGAGRARRVSAGSVAGLGGSRTGPERPPLRAAQSGTRRLTPLGGRGVWEYGQRTAPVRGFCDPGEPRCSRARPPCIPPHPLFHPPWQPSAPVLLGPRLLLLPHVSHLVRP